MSTMSVEQQQLRGPRGHFIAGHLPEFRRDTLGFLVRCAREYGDFVPLRFARRRALLVSHPAAIEEVLVTQNRAFVKSPAYGLLRPLAGNGLFTSEGDFWRRQRRLMQPAFHRERIAVYANLMVDYAQRMAESWQDGEVRDVHHDMMGLTLSVVAKTLFTAEVAEEAPEVGEALTFALEYFERRMNSLWFMVPDVLPTPAHRRLQKAVRQLDEIVYQIVEQRRRTGEDRGDLLSMLLHAEDEDDGSRMTNQQVRDEVMTLFLAGHETTALALTWAWHLVAQHPDAEARRGRCWNNGDERQSGPPEGRPPWIRNPAPSRRWQAEEPRGQS